MHRNDTKYHRTGFSSVEYGKTAWFRSIRLPCIESLLHKRQLHTCAFFTTERVENQEFRLMVGLTSDKCNVASSSRWQSNVAPALAIKCCSSATAETVAFAVKSIAFRDRLAFGYLLHSTTMSNITVVLNLLDYKTPFGCNTKSRYPQHNKQLGL